jgi:restriction endonuclease S subunit
MGLRVGSGLPNIQTKSLAEFLVDVPSDPTEAADLTRVLDDVDTEIDALIAQREKAELVKQGMMQELLSGRVRLV